jgi:hypothetical protein
VRATRAYLGTLGVGMDLDGDGADEVYVSDTEGNWTKYSLVD